VRRGAVERRLKSVGKRVRGLRDELRVIDEQLLHMADDEDSAGIRAIVSDSPEAGRDAREAGAHADALRRHRRHVLDTLADLEARQDELLDELSRRPD
jgi:hypothetical protein